MFLQIVVDAVALASGQERLSPFHRLLLASVWTRNGLPAPEVLEFSASDIAASDMPDHADPQALLDDLFRDLIALTEGDALACHPGVDKTT